MRLRKEERKRLEGFYQRKDYTRARYGKKWMKTYSQIRVNKINKIIESSFNRDEKVSLLDVGCGTGLLIKQLNKKNSNYRKV